MKKIHLVRSPHNKNLNLRYHIHLTNNVHSMGKTLQISNLLIIILCLVQQQQKQKWSNLKFPPLHWSLHHFPISFNVYIITQCFYYYSSVIRLIFANKVALRTNDMRRQSARLNSVLMTHIVVFAVLVESSDCAAAKIAFGTIFTSLINTHKSNNAKTLA